MLVYQMVFVYCFCSLPKGFVGQCGSVSTSPKRWRLRNWTLPIADLMWILYDWVSLWATDKLMGWKTARGRTSIDQYSNTHYDYGCDRLMKYSFKIHMIFPLKPPFLGDFPTFHDTVSGRFRAMSPTWTTGHSQWLTSQTAADLRAFIHTDPNTARY